MTIAMIAVRPRHALDVLGQTVRAAKDGDPLRSVTVIVPTNATGVSARRYLGRNGGIAAIDILTLHRLAEVLGGPSLVAEGKRPVSAPVVDLAVRAVLAERPGAFAEVADHPSTVVALRDLHRELRLAGPESPARLAQSSDRGREAATISTLVTRRLEENWYDEADLALRAIESMPTDAGVNRIVVFLPHPPGGLDLAMLASLGAHADLRIIMAITGDQAIDAEVATTASALGTDCDITEFSTLVATGGRELSITSTTDADEETRHAVRAVVDAARSGTPFGRIAVLWPSDRPYARLVEHHLTIAEIPWNGRPGTGVSERLVPRFLLDLLDVDRRGLRRRDVFDLLADLPLRGPLGTPVPTARWERISREAGVTRDEDWLPRLRSYAARHRQRDTQAGRAESFRANDADQLSEFVNDLRSSLGHRHAKRTWHDWAAWSEHQIVRRLGQNFLQQLSEPERLALEHTNRVLDRLRHLDSVGEPVQRSEFRAVFAAEFDVAPGRLGRIGRGVTIGSLSGAVGLDIDLAIVIGGSDALMPPAPSSGPLVSESDRKAAGLLSSDAAGLRLHRQLTSVLDSAGRSIVLFPRGDLRATATRRASRWLEPLIASQPTHHVPSHHSALLGTPFPSHSSEHRLRGLLADVATGSQLSPCSDRTDLVLERALEVRAARRSDRITIFDGDLSSMHIEHFVQAISPTQLEQWVSCPHGYFVKHMLGVYPIEEPGDQMEITPADRGNLVHVALDRFHREVIDGTIPQPSPRGWSEPARRRLAELFHESALEFDETGRTGREASWRVERDTVFSELMHWFDRDGVRSAQLGATVIGSEQFFGNNEVVSLVLNDGRKLPVRGQIDRVDRTQSGELIVTDHKSGRSEQFKDITADDPTASGTKFQLPAYAAGAMILAGSADPGGPVRAEYSFFGKGKYARIGYSMTSEVWSEVTAKITDVVNGIEAGFFPAIPEPPGFQLYVKCQYCQPDALGTGERFPEWIRKRNDPRSDQWFGETA